jgi:hypothetical protein
VAILDLGPLLEGLEPGTWVVLDHDMTRRLGHGESPDAALSAAGLSTQPYYHEDWNEDRPVLMCIPDPSKCRVCGR